MRTYAACERAPHGRVCGCTRGCATSLNLAIAGR